MRVMDRRLFLRSSGGLGTMMLLAQTAPPIGSRSVEPPAEGRPLPAPARPQPSPRGAWINFEFAITWERVDVLQEIVTNLVGRGITAVTRQSAPTPS